MKQNPGQIISATCGQLRQRTLVSCISFTHSCEGLSGLSELCKGLVHLLYIQADDGFTVGARATWSVVSGWDGLQIAQYTLIL